jgi:hypothetical protein
VTLDGDNTSNGEYFNFQAAPNNNRRNDGGNNGSSSATGGSGIYPFEFD